MYTSIRTITRIHICNWIPKFSIHMAMRLNTGVPAITVLSLVQYIGIFDSCHFESICFSWLATSLNNWHHPPIAIRSMISVQPGCWSFHHSIKQLHESQDKFRDQSAPRCTISGDDDNYHMYGTHYSPQPMREIKYDIHMSVQKPLLQVNWASLSVVEPTIHGAILALNWQYSEGSSSRERTSESLQVRQYLLQLNNVHQHQLQ